MTTWPQGYETRPIALDDIGDLVDLIARYGEAIGDEDEVSAELLTAQLTMPGFDLDDSTWLVTSADGALAAAGFVIDNMSPYVRVLAAGIVDPGHRNLGLGTELHERMLARARGAIEKAPEGARVHLQQSAMEKDRATMRFLEGAGYVQTRHFWKMAIDLDGEIPTPQWPDGLTLSELRPNENLETLAKAVNDAFRDHYGHVEGDLDERVARLRHSVENNPEFDATLHFIVRDGTEIAAVCFGATRHERSEAVGYIETLGVRPGWRRRGLGLALLHHSFGEFKRRDLRRASLHVDAQSLTGATRLYERAGMSVAELAHEYQLELRPGTDLGAS